MIEHNDNRVAGAAGLDYIVMAYIVMATSWQELPASPQPTARAAWVFFDIHIYF